MTELSGLEQFADRLHPAVLDDVRLWEGDPILGKIHAALSGHTNLKRFMDTWAEAIVARHLLARGCRLRFEIPTPAGRACDFEVTAADGTFYLHVKRVHTERPARRRLTISSSQFIQRVWLAS